VVGERREVVHAAILAAGQAASAWVSNCQPDDGWIFASIRERRGGPVSRRSGLPPTSSGGRHLDGRVTPGYG
jgi:hypothetical protein